jgi:predicted O-linked N-acetylglucosamine transferase (SPINDLY family)
VQICDDGLRSDPANVSLLYIGAIALFKLKRLPESLQRFDKLLSVQPGHLIAINERGSVLAEMRDFDEALAAFEKAARINPRFAEAHLNIGNVLGELDRHEEAKSSFEKALALDPKLARAWSGLGNTLRERGLFDEALAAYDKALALAPALAEAWIGRGNALYEQSRSDEALTAYDKAVALAPNLAQAWLGRGNSLGKLNRYPDALIAYERALALDCDLPKAWFGRGNILSQLKEYDKAVAALDRALSLKPDLKFAKGDWIHAKLQIGDWANLDVAISQLVASVKAHELACAPFQFLGISASPADQLQCMKRFIADQPSFPSVWRGEIYAHDRIRIGYFSADFCRHPVAQLAVGLFEAHDQSRFEIIAISVGPEDGSELRRRIKSAFEEFIDVREMNDADIAALIRRRELDVIVDLTGLTGFNRSSVLSRRVAPVQVNFLGYPGTMGADWMDYIMVDRTIIPEEHFPFFSEKVVWLPDTYQANDDKRHISERKPTRAECGLPENAFVFCCFNSTYKITPEIFDVWMRLLAAKAGSALWLIGTHPTAEANLRREAEQRGIPAARLLFAPRMPLADHLARSGQADLFLDTMPYNAHTTGSDALWAGVPVLTCLGSTFASRVGASIVKAAGLDELVTNSLQEYEALALKLANDPSQLRALRERLARHRSTCPLFDTARFARHIEAAYTTMWQRYQRGEPPQTFAVDRLA